MDDSILNLIVFASLAFAGLIAIIFGRIKTYRRNNAFKKLEVAKANLLDKAPLALEKDYSTYEVGSWREKPPRARQIARKRRVEAIQVQLKKEISTLVQSEIRLCIHKTAYPETTRETCTKYQKAIEASIESLIKESRYLQQ